MTSARGRFDCQGYDRRLAQRSNRVEGGRKMRGSEEKGEVDEEA